MKLKVFSVCFALIVSSLSVYSQKSKPSPTPTRKRVIVVGEKSKAKPKETTKATPKATPKPKPKVVVTNTLPSPKPTPIPKPKTTPIPNSTPVVADNSVKSTEVPPSFPFRTLNFREIKNRIAEAKRQMQTRPLPTGLTDSFLLTDVIRIAFFDYENNEIDYVSMTKESFLSTKTDVSTTSQNGKSITVRTIRGNGVNTPVYVLDEKNRAHLPLMVQYPVERGGTFYEMAYYMSTHPGIVTPEVVNAGKFYVRNTVEAAREKLRQRSIVISPQVADMAERLIVVEHVDHYRFRTEYHPNIYNDVFALYALNEGQTYRYAVSSAGAGGMVQMIPSTYRMIRSRYPGVDLMPDFVEGMRDHVNAAQAMLLYMQMTWNDLVSNNTVYEALQSGIATPAELMSAGYNSNPARLPGYIKRGGANWKNLIPRETKIYLQINESIDRYVPMTPRTK